MIALINKTAAVAGLALAALPFVALGFAHAAPAPATIKIGDLNLSRPADVRIFERRVDRVADRMCSSDRSLSYRAVCKQAVRAEAMDKFAEATSASVAVASR